MMSTSNNCAIYHQTKTPISFWCRREINPKSIIQSSKTLLVELTETHLEFIIYLLETFFFFFGEIPFINLE